MKPDLPSKWSQKIKFLSLVKVDLYVNVYSYICPYIEVSVLIFLDLATSATKLIVLNMYCTHKNLVSIGPLPRKFKNLILVVFPICHLQCNTLLSV